MREVILSLIPKVIAAPTWTALLDKSQPVYTPAYPAVAKSTNAISRESQMIVSSASDYREAARRSLPCFLFDYVDGGANAEQTMKPNIADLNQVNLRQRVLKNVSDLNLATEWFSQASALPVIIGPVGLTGMLARRELVAWRFLKTYLAVGSASLMPLERISHPRVRSSD